MSKEFINKFLEKAREAKNVEEFHKIASSTKTAMRRKLKTREKDIEQYPNKELKNRKGWTPNTAHKYCTLLRKAVKEEFNNPEYDKVAHRLFRLMGKELTKRNQTYQKNVIKRHDTGGQVELSAEAADKIIEIAERELDTAITDKLSHFKIALALIALTGRRFHEIYSEAKLDEMNTIGKHSIYFSGQAKIKEGEEESLSEYKIPVLGNPKKILKAWKILREMKPEYVGRDSDTLNNSLQTQLSRYMKQYHSKGEYVGVDKPYEFRAFYGAVSFDKFPQADTDDLHIKRVMGHAGGSLSMSTSYKRFKRG